MLDKNGMPVIEEVEVKIPAFRVVPVFDVSQTDRKELPDIGVSELLGSVQDYGKFMQVLTEISPIPISYEQIDGDSKGYFHILEHRIALQEETSQSHTIKTAVHEVAHAKLHDKELNSELEESIQKDRSTKEVEAESIAYTVCQHFGIDTSDYSFGYTAGWSSGKNRKELKSSLDIIRKTASELITGISERLQEMKMNRVEEQELLSIQRADQTFTMEKAEELLEETTQESVVETLESEKQTENRRNMENIETNKISYYVIADISTWAENSSEKSKLEYFDSLSEAIEKFSQYRADITNDSDERTRTTLGASINGREVDVAYAICHENILSLDFTHSQTAQESKRFIEALQTLCVELPIDRVRVHRNMTSEEIKNFVKKHLVYQLNPHHRHIRIK